ncbi:DUF1642 domain-containing protein [Enterococcus faecium]|nr:DUF1642 domain-containing protein [Enterococcus faecium]
MNKQELIGKWENKKGAPSYEISAFPVNPSLNEMYIAGYGVAKTEILKDLNQLDEPQKPVVPQSIAVLIEKYKEDDVQLTDILVCFKDWLESEEGDYRDEISWVVANPETFMRAWLDGYEVEQEPLYRVIMPNPQAKNGNVLVLRKTQQGTITVNKVKTFTALHGEGLDLTEDEIKSVDERYWSFAVPVEEG